MWSAACRDLRGLSYDGPSPGANGIVVYTAAGYLLVGASTGMTGIAYAWALPGALLCLLGLLPRQVWSRGRGLLAGGLLLLALPLLWRPALTGDAWRADTRVACTAMGVILLAWLSAQRPPLRTARQCGWLILLAGLVCVLAVLRQTYWPASHALWMPSVADGRPSGTFHQINVMASFLATGLAVTLHLWLSGRQRVALPAALVAFAFALTLCQSTIGWLGALTVTVILGMCAWKTRRRAVSVAVCALVLGWGMGRASRWLTHAAGVDHDGGRLGRLQMWHASQRLIADRPWLGHGYGSFEGIYPGALRALGVHPLNGLVRFPHNEILYWLVEGGVVAGAGLLCLSLWGAMLFYRAWRDARDAGGYGQPGSDAFGWLVCTLPVLLHTQVEYPLYQSPLHYTLLVLLTGLGAARLTRPLPVWQPGRTAAMAIRLAALAGGVAVVAFAVTGARVAAAYDVANRTTGLVVQPLIQARAWDPWYDPEAVGYALMLHDIRVYGANHDPALPGRIATFLQGYLVHHPDPNAYTMYLAVLHLEGQEATYQRVLKEARWRVAWDPRYAAAGALRDGTTPPSAKATHEDNSSTKGE